MYHRVCVTEWLVAHTQCPLCKQDVLELLEQEEYVHSQIARLRQISAERESPPAEPLSVNMVYEADESTNPVVLAGAGAAAPRPAAGTAAVPADRAQASTGLTAATAATAATTASVDDVPT
jgi:hypothetical protein